MVRDKDSTFELESVPMIPLKTFYAQIIKAFMKSNAKCVRVHTTKKFGTLINGLNRAIIALRLTDKVSAHYREKEIYLIKKGVRKNGE